MGEPLPCYVTDHVVRQAERVLTRPGP